MRYYWDDPVVITYSPGNELAPHNDLRDLTIGKPVIPVCLLMFNIGYQTIFQIYCIILYFCFVFRPNFTYLRLTLTF